MLPANNKQQNKNKPKNKQMNKKRQFLLSAALASVLAANAQVTIHVDASNPGVKVSPNLYGIFFEDINHAADGGLYAELISNRSLRMTTRTSLPGKLPPRKVQKSRHNSSTRVCSTRHRARLSSLPLLPNQLPQPLSSTKASGASTPFGAEPTSSLSGQRVATRAD